ncbi:MAG TPA: hypothetical protein VNH41_03460 [Steroidobacteraceae bacterium]|nr:hypothetical protein [Steroidobacteraceae bacterium]
MADREAIREVRMLLASKHECSPTLSRKGRDLIDAFESALGQAATNLAWKGEARPDESMGEAAERIYDELLQGSPSEKPGTHGRGCPCTPCRAEDWDEIERNLHRKVADAD